MAALQGLHAAREALLDLQAQSQKQRQNQTAKRCAAICPHILSLHWGVQSVMYGLRRGVCDGNGVTLQAS